MPRAEVEVELEGEGDGELSISGKTTDHALMQRREQCPPLESEKSLGKA